MKFEDAKSKSFFAIGNSIPKKVKSIKKVSKDEFEKLVKPGDVVISYMDRKKLSALGSLTKAFTSLAQASSFSSCKMIGEEGKTIIGYDVIGRGLELNHYRIRTYLNHVAGCVVLRHKKATKKDCDKMVKWLKEREKMKIPYSMWNVLVSALKHLFGSLPYKKEEPTQDDLKHYSEPSFCSAIVQRAYDSVGLDTGIGEDVGKDYVWPKDFLFSSKFTAVCGYFIPGEVDDL